MSADRCSQCRGVIRAGADWCGLCFADLRPAPPPPPPPLPPPPPPTHVERAVFNDAPGPARPVDLLDPFTTPLGVLTGEIAELDPHPTATAPAAATGWPCLECGTRNDFELSACVSCGTAFGAGLREAAPTLPGTRQTRLIVAGAAVAVVMAVIALLTFFTGSVPEKDEIIDSPPVPIEEPAAPLQG